MNKKKILNKERIEVFPKVELHRHIEGSFCLKTIFKIAQKNNVEGVSDNFDEFVKNAQFPKNHKPDFKLFLSKFRNDWYRSFEDVYDVIYNSVLGFKKENLFFIELRFSPEHFALFNNFDRIETTKIILEAAKKAAKEIGTIIKFLITFNRNKQTQQEMSALYKKIVHEGFNDIIGMDLAGDEILNPPHEFVDFFDEIHADGVGITIHAGEVTNPEQIWLAINDLHAQRIGHGTKCVEDEKLVEELVKRNILLEQCPVSNSLTGAWEDVKTHPFKDLNKQNVLVTLNSDDPTVQNTTLGDDFIAAIKYFDIDYKALVDLNIRSLQGSFASNKIQIISDYKAAVKEFEKNFL